MDKAIDRIWDDRGARWVSLVPVLCQVCECSDQYCTSRSGLGLMSEDASIRSMDQTHRLIALVNYMN